MNRVKLKVSLYLLFIAGYYTDGIAYLIVGAF
jgi:hypothetical protein